MLSTMLTLSVHVLLDCKWIKWIRAKLQVCVLSTLAYDIFLPMKLPCAKWLFSR